MQAPSALFPGMYQRPWRRALSALRMAISDKPGPSFLTGIMVVSAVAGASINHLAPNAAEQVSPLVQPALIGLSLLLAGCYAAPVLDETRKYYQSATRLQEPSR